MQLVRDLLVYWKGKNVTIVLNSHHLDEVEKVCDRVAFIKKGHIESIERIQEVNFSQIKVAIKWIGGSAENGSTGEDSTGTETSENETLNRGLSKNDLREKLEIIASSMNVSLESIDDSCARFVLNERSDKAVLIKKLVEADVPVEEVILEKKALKDFFVERARDSEEGEQT
jgi:ABC-type multidrug transport system ATPase subunit